MDQHPPPLQQISDKEKENPNSQTYAHLLESLTSFLIISIHSILYTRSLYPLETFLLARAYNYPVYQSRHPRVCQWVNEAVASVVEQVGRGFVERVAVVIYCDDDGLQSIEKGGENEKGKEKGIRKGEVQILERHIFDLSQFPHIPNKEDFHTEIERVPNGEEGKVPNMVDTEEQLRGALGRLALVGGNLRPLPKDKNCTFGVVVELKDGNGEATPIGHPQPWIPSTPSLQPVKSPTPTGSVMKDVSGVKTTPVRSVVAGEFIMEMWVEEGSAKLTNT